MSSPLLTDSKLQFSRSSLPIVVLFPPLSFLILGIFSSICYLESIGLSVTRLESLVYKVKIREVSFACSLDLILPECLIHTKNARLGHADL